MNSLYFCHFQTQTYWVSEVCFFKFSYSSTFFNEMKNPKVAINENPNPIKIYRQPLEVKQFPIKNVISKA